MAKVLDRQSYGWGEQPPYNTLCFLRFLYGASWVFCLRVIVIRIRIQSIAVFYLFLMCIVVINISTNELLSLVECQNCVSYILIPEVLKCYTGPLFEMMMSIENQELGQVSSILQQFVFCLLPLSYCKDTL